MQNTRELCTQKWRRNAIRYQNNQFNIYKSIFMLNRAKIGGGIYFQSQSNLNQENFVNSMLLFNQAEIYGNNLVEDPTHLSINLNQIEMPSIQLYLDNKSIQALEVKPYKIIEQGQLLEAQELMIPSNQVIKNYKIYLPKLQTFKNYIQIISIHFKNSFNEKLENLNDSSCIIETTINFENKSIASSERTIQNLVYDQDAKALDLSSLTFSFDPYFQVNQLLSIVLNCKAQSSQQTLQYYIYAKTFKCQLGEFYVDKGCQLCSSTQGFYSVTYNTTKCSIFDKEKFDSITSNKIKLLGGFWRPNYLSDFTERCAKIQNFVLVVGKLEITYVLKVIQEAYVKNAIILIFEDLECFIKMCRKFNVLDVKIFRTLSCHLSQHPHGLQYLFQQLQEALKNRINYSHLQRLDKDLAKSFLSQIKIMKVF